MVHKYENIHSKIKAKVDTQCPKQFSNVMFIYL